MILISDSLSSEGNRELGHNESALPDVSWFSFRSTFVYTRNHFFKTSSMPHAGFITGQIEGNKAPWKLNNSMNVLQIWPGSVAE